MAWAVVYVENGEIVREETGALYAGTNNKAELLAVIWALERFGADRDLVIRTDSALTRNIAIGEWTPKTNLDLWERFEQAMARRKQRRLKTHFEHVRGHADDQFNNRADERARESAARAAACLDETTLD